MQAAALAFRAPKTVLGFFAIVLGIVVAGASVALGIFSRTPALHNLITPILLFVAVLIVALLVGVFITAWKDPTVLMLGEISGEAFIENRKLTLGDSVFGETRENIQVAVASANAQRSLGPAVVRSEDSQ